nr:integrase, catalytic region, zinc finger, CCHC-type, peptidase aspartic, catalytic [Tanacetum cinerariifolium]
IVQICLWIIDSGCSKHMTGNRALLMNFLEKFLGTVRFGNNDFAMIAGYGDVVIDNDSISIFDALAMADEFLGKNIMYKRIVVFAGGLTVDLIEADLIEADCY